MDVAPKGVRVHHRETWPGWQLREVENGGHEERSLSFNAKTSPILSLFFLVLFVSYDVEYASRGAGYEA